jgi:hypothetical protein
MVATPPIDLFPALPGSCASGPAAAVCRAWREARGRGPVASLLVGALVAVAQVLPAVAAPAIAQEPAPRVDSVPTAALTVPPDAYEDPAAAEIVARARAHKAGEDSSLLGYRAMVTQRVGVGIRALRRDRILYHHELVARVEWHRGDTARVQVLGARAGVPIVSSDGQVPEDLRDLFADLAFDPDADLLRFGGPARGDSVRHEGLLHPLAPGAESSYRYRSGDTTVIRFPDGRSITVVELVVIPRRAEFRLVAGSFWFDTRSYGLVRAVFRLARPFDLARDGDPGDDDDVPAVFRPVRADIRFVTIEYGLEGFRWWLPHLVAFEGFAQAGSLIGIPVRFDRRYTEYQVDGGGGLPPARPVSVPQRSAEELAAAREAQQRREARRHVRVRAEVKLGGDSARADTARGDSARSRFPVVVIAPPDTAALADSPYLPPALFEPGAALVSEADLREMGRSLGILSAVPSPGATGSFRWAPRDPTLLRYNRVEGLSFGARYDVDFGALALDASARVGWADLVPNAELGVTRATTGSRQRLAVYSRLASADPSARPFGIGNSLEALLFGRDDGDYFRAHGLEATLAPAMARPQWFHVRVYAELQRAAEKGTDASLRRLWESGHRFRPMVTARRADQVGAALTFRGQYGADPARLVLAGELSAQGELGDARFAKGAVTARAAFPLPLGVAGALEMASGSSVGSVTPQALWYLGGPGTLRGYAGAAAVGDAFWRARVDLAPRGTAARLVLFGDAGWAGSRADFAAHAPWRGKPLLAWGIGTSFLDGLIRLDVARGLRAPAGWRVDLYWDGTL